MHAMAEHVDKAHASVTDAGSLRTRAEELERQADTLREMVTSSAAALHPE
jgi:hypothetical protein